MVRRVDEGLLSGNRENREKEKDKQKKKPEKKEPVIRQKKKIKDWREFKRKGLFERPSGVDMDKLFRKLK